MTVTLQDKIIINEQLHSTIHTYFRHYLPYHFFILALNHCTKQCDLHYPYIIASLPIQIISSALFIFMNSTYMYIHIHICYSIIRGCCYGTALLFLLWLLLVLFSLLRKIFQS